MQNLLSQARKPDYIHWSKNQNKQKKHYGDVIMGTIASQITSLTIVYSTVYSDADKKNPSKLRVTGLCAGIQRGPVNSPHKWPVTRKIFAFDDVIMNARNIKSNLLHATD